MPISKKSQVMMAFKVEDKVYVPTCHTFGSSLAGDDLYRLTSLVMHDEKEGDIYVGKVGNLYLIKIYHNYYLVFATFSQTTL